jgi:pimeloyl-ACP methyl ester carboxylesterase
VHFVEIGAGTPVLAIHGWTPDHRLMLGCLEPVFATRPGYRRLYPDLPGMGRSPAGDVASADDLLAALEEFVDAQIGSEPFLLAGQSYGGYLARALAHRRPGQVAGLALSCPTGKFLRRSESTVPELEVRWPDAGVEGLDPVLAEEFLPMAVVQTPEVVRRFADEVLAGLQVADREAMARIQRRWDLSEGPELGVFERPALFLTGRQDNITGYADVYALLPHYPHASFAVLDTAGHNLQIEQPVLFGALVGEWLDRVERAG